MYGGYPFIRGFLDEMKSKKFGMMTLITVAITTAYSYSSAVVFGVEGKIFFWELATLIDIMLLGHWIEMKSVMGASSAIEDLAKLLPLHAHKLMRDNSTEDVPLQELTAGDLVLVKPGEKVPVDGIVVEGETTVDESMLTGESKPVLKEKGNAVIGGWVNKRRRFNHCKGYENRKMVQNLTWATGYNVFAIPLAAGVLYSAGILLTPAIGAVLISLSTVIVSINARLLR